MDAQQWHYYLKAQRPYMGTPSNNVAVDLIKPDKGLAFKGKDYGMFTPPFFGSYNLPNKRDSCCKANCNKSK